MRTTIDYGIHLGTTNSEIAVWRGTEVEVFKNDDRDERTPSVVYMQKGGALYVGRRAKRKVVEEPENAFAEFMLKMGQNETYTFARTGREMKPEDLSAEVLKSLRADVKTATGEEVDAAVITVPTTFELPLCDATQRAARQAGIVTCPLLQETVAAALAYGFQSEANKSFWLVFDYEGGTFDAAVVQVRDGIISVVNHEGDNYLGWKLIDWDIVNRLLIPELTKQYRLTDFRKGNPKWKAAIAKLKGKAEDAKIALSHNAIANVDAENLCADDRGDRVDFVYELKRADVEAIMEPYVARAVGLCRKALSAKHLASGDIDRLVLAGGATLSTFLRDRLADPKEGLGIPLDFRIDPFTVFARGAAVFAGTQRLENPSGPKAAPVQYFVDLEYKPVGTDPEPLIGGTVHAPDGRSLAGHTIEFLNAGMAPPWRSGRIGLSPNGTFMTNLCTHRARVNTFIIEIRDSTGGQGEVVPDRIIYTIGLTTTDPPLLHSVGIALPNNEMEFLLMRGDPLPTRRRMIWRTAVDTRRGEGGYVIHLQVMEGESPRADRNQCIGTLRIESKSLKHDLPAGSEVEVTIEIDQSRILRTKVFIPLLDEEFEQVIDYKKHEQAALRPGNTPAANAPHEPLPERERSEDAGDASDPAADAIDEHHGQGGSPQNIVDVLSREALVGRLLFVMQSPIRGLVTVLSANVRNVAVVLDQIANEKTRAEAKAKSARKPASAPVPAARQVPAAPRETISVPEPPARPRMPAPAAPRESIPARERSEVLLAMATPDLYRRNPFRLTGMGVTATPREMARQAEKLKMMERLGTPPAPASLGLPLDQPPGAEAIREAMQQLQDPEMRLIDEVFWLWPMPGNDEALDLFKGGDANAAKKVWQQAAGAPKYDAARHNLAVLQHARALENDSTSKEEWTEVFERWQRLLEAESFWSRVAERIRELDDPRLTTGTARRLRHTLPLALLTISARLAVRAAEAGDMDRAKQQRDIALASGFDQATIDEALVAAVTPIRDRLQTLCKAADAESDADPAHADQVVERLLEQTRELLQAMAVTLPQASPARTGAFDQVALRALGCQIVYGNKTAQWTICAGLLVKIKAIPVSESARSRIQQSIDTVEGNRVVTTCWFCGTGRASLAAVIEVKMYGNVKRTPTWRGVEITWNHGTVPVPRCAGCKKSHNSFGKPAALGCLGSLLGVGSCFFAMTVVPAQDGTPLGIGWGIILVSIIAALVWHARIRPRIKPASAANTFPVILEKKKQGWNFGVRPS